MRRLSTSDQDSGQDLRFTRLRVRYRLGHLVPPAGPVAPGSNPSRLRGVVSTLAIGGTLVLLAGCGESGGGGDGGGDGGGSSSEPELTRAKVAGGCPTTLAAGVTDYATFRVTPREDWPVAYASIYDGEDLVDAASLEGASAREARTPAIETYELRGGIQQGRTETIKLALLGVSPEKTTVKFQFWGDEPGARSLPSGGALYECDVTITP